MDPNIIKYANAEAQGTGAQFDALLLGQAPDPDIAIVANNVLNRIRQAGEDQVLDDPRNDRLGMANYAFRIPALETVSARAGNGVRDVLRLVDKRVYESLLEEERDRLDQDDRRSGDLLATRSLPDGLGRFLREGVRLFNDDGLPGLLGMRGQRDVSVLGRFSPQEQRLQRRLDARLATFNPEVAGPDRDMVARELARLNPQHLLFDLPELRTWAIGEMIPNSTTTVNARLEEIIGTPNMSQQSIVPLLSYLRGDPARVATLQGFYAESQGGDVEGAREALNGTTAEPGLKPIYEAEKKRHGDIDAAFKRELEVHERARRTYERDENERIGRFDEAATKLSTVHKDMEELLGIPGKITSINQEITALPVMPTPTPAPAAPQPPSLIVPASSSTRLPSSGPSAPPTQPPTIVNVTIPPPPAPTSVDPSVYRRAELDKEKRGLTDRQADLRRSVIRRYQEYAGEFSVEIAANAPLFKNNLLSGLTAANINSIDDSTLESLTLMMATLRAQKRPATATMRTELDRLDEAKREIEERRTAWEEYKKTPYEDRANPAPATCLPTSVTLAAPHPRLLALRVHSLESLKTRYDEAERAYNEALTKVANSPFKKNPLSPEALLYELQLRDAALAPLLSPEKETRSLVRTMILLHEARSRVNEGATQRRADHIHVGASPGGNYRPFDDIQRDTFLRDERLRGVEGITLKSTVQDVLTKISSGALSEEQLHLYIHQLELLGQDRLEGANLAHGEDVRNLIHNCCVAYYTLKARTALSEIGDRSGPLDKTSELRTKILDAVKPSDAPALAVETARVATNRLRLEKAQAEAEAEAEADGPAHKRAEAIAKWGELAFLVLGTKGVFNVLARVGHLLRRRKSKQLPPPGQALQTS